MRNIFNWIRFSGAIASVTLNPIHWIWLPRAYREHNREWPDGHFRSYRAGWLFLSIRVWIDDGSW